MIKAYALKFQVTLEIQIFAKDSGSDETIACGITYLSVQLFFKPDSENFTNLN